MQDNYLPAGGNTVGGVTLSKCSSRIERIVVNSCSLSTILDHYHGTFNCDKEHVTIFGNSAYEYQ